MNEVNLYVIATGVWQSRDELRELRQIDRVFEPRARVYEAYDSILTLWNQALDRFLDWYDT
jgi:Glycerol kinase